MIELLFTFLVAFGIVLPFFFGCQIYRFIKIMIVTLQLILFFVNLKDNFTSSERELKYELIHELPFKPINSINSSGGYYLIIEKLDNKNYSLVKVENFTKGCFPNFYINEMYDCPISDIIIENNKSFNHEGYTEIIINDNKYLYYSKKNISGGLYKNIYYDSITNNREIDNYLSLNSFKKKKEYEDLKFENPYRKYYLYSKYTYFFLIIILIFLLFINYIESPEKRIFDIFKIIGYIFDIIIFIILVLGFDLFIKAKHFVLNANNKDLLNFLGYSPKRFDNNHLECIIFSSEIIKILYEILYIIIPKDCCKCQNKNKNDCIYFLSFFPLFFIYFFFSFWIMIITIVYKSIMII